MRFRSKEQGTRVNFSSCFISHFISGKESLALKDLSVTKPRILTKAFYLKRKALFMLPGKLRHDTEIMITCDRVINLEFDVFLKAIHNGRNIINTAKSEIVRWFIV